MPVTKLSVSVVLLVVLALMGPSHQQCTLSSSSSSDLLQSGSSLLYNARSNTREHLFSISASFSVPSSGLQVAASVSTLQVAVTGGLDFSVRGLPGQSYGSVQIVLLINEDNTWNTIRVNYLITGRSDFLLGFFVADLYLATKNSNSASFQANVPNRLPAQGSYTSVVQFSGVRTASNSISISFASLSFNPATSVLSISISIPYALSIENIHITYIIFSRSSPITFSSFNPSNPPSTAYSFIGLETINSAGSTFSGSAFSGSSTSGLTCVGSGCPSTCLSSQSCLSLGGQISGNVCYICASGQVLVNGQCQTANQCGQNQYWTGTQCLCNSGYVLVSGQCYQSCGTNAYIYNNQCVCMPGYTYSTSAYQCVSQTISCGTNYVVVNGNCVCPSGFGIINNLCLTCPANSYVNSNGNCQCVTGYVLSSTTLSCVVQNNCFPNSTPNSLGQCVCNNGYYNQGNQCIPQSCSGGMVFNGVSCVCPTGQYVDSITSQCTLCNNFGQAVQGNTCVCSATYYPTSSGCAPCPANSVYNSVQKLCVCLSGYTLTNGQCVSQPTCPSGAQWNSLTSACQCTTSGYYIINNVCTPCPANSQWNGSSCQCNSGYTLTAGVCVSSCPGGSVWNGQSCVCATGTYLIGGSCVTCDPNSSYNASQVTCLCNNGYYGNWQKCYSCDSTCATCWGPGNNQCTSCRGTSSLNTNGGCNSGCGAGQFVNSNNICTACMANCILCYSIDSCTTCATGYNKSLSVVSGNIVMACTPIPTGTNSTLSLRSFVIGNGVVYQGVAMSLMPTDILANGCTVCDQLLLVNIASTYAQATASVSYVVNSQYWFLITFDFTGASFIPSFQFTVQINPAYATSFSSQDMAQKLVSTINPQTNYLSTNNQGIIPRPSTGTKTYTSSGNSTSSVTPTTTQFSSKVTNSQLTAIFG